MASDARGSGAILFAYRADGLTVRGRRVIGVGATTAACPPLVALSAVSRVLPVAPALARTVEISSERMRDIGADSPESLLRLWTSVGAAAHVKCGSGTPWFWADLPGFDVIEELAVFALGGAVSIEGTIRSPTSALASPAAGSRPALSAASPVFSACRPPPASPFVRGRLLMYLFFTDHHLHIPPAYFHHLAAVLRCLGWCSRRCRQCPTLTHTAHCDTRKSGAGVPTSNASHHPSTCKQRLRGEAIPCHWWQQQKCLASIHCFSLDPILPCVLGLVGCLSC